MPTIIEIPLTLQPIGHPTHGEQRAMHAILFKTIDKTNPKLAQELHDQYIKPITQGILYHKNEEVTWRITLLDDALLEPICHSLEQQLQWQVQKRSVTLNWAEKVCKTTPYAELAQSKPQSQYSFTFLTPTSFKKQYYHDPIPEPYACFRSWRARWQQFAPENMSINIAVLDVVQAHMVISRFNLRSRMMVDGKRKIVGGIGNVTFTALKSHKVESIWWQHIATLAAFARYCGTGHKTMQGLGQTEPPNLLRNLSVTHIS